MFIYLTSSFLKPVQFLGLCMSIPIGKDKKHEDDNTKYGEGVIIKLVAIGDLNKVVVLTYTKKKKKTKKNRNIFLQIFKNVC
jgi:hypothetical protein